MREDPDERGEEMRPFTKPGNGPERKAAIADLHLHRRPVENESERTNLSKQAANVR